MEEYEHEQQEQQQHKYPHEEHSSMMWGLQSGPSSNGLTSGGSMIYDPYRDTILITGTTHSFDYYKPFGDNNDDNYAEGFYHVYHDTEDNNNNDNEMANSMRSTVRGYKDYTIPTDGTDCFLATIQNGEWKTQTRLGFPTSSCFATSILNNELHHWYVAGYQQPQTLTLQPQSQPLQHAQHAQAHHAGKTSSATTTPLSSSTLEMILGITEFDQQTNSRVESIIPSFIESNEQQQQQPHYKQPPPMVTIPTAMSSDRRSLYVATIQQEHDANHNRFDVAIHKLTPGNHASTRNVLEEQWLQVYHSQDKHTDKQQPQLLFAQQPSITIASLLYVNHNTLLVAGGAPKGFDHPLVPTTSTRGHGDMDGFITKLDPKTGEIATMHQHYTRSISSISTSDDGTRLDNDDFIHALCLPPMDDMSQSSSLPDAVYVVGSTEGSIMIDKQHHEVDPQDGGAFIIKLDLHTFQIIWSKQISGMDVYGISCAVTNDNEYVYLAGEVMNGYIIHNSTLSISPRSSDGSHQKTGLDDDIFVTRLATEDGAIQWTRQVGSPYDESLANGGGGITVDPFGNAMIYGNTHGSISRNRLENELYSDVFVLTLHHRDGYNIIDDTLQHQNHHHSKEESSATMSSTNTDTLLSSSASLQLEQQQQQDRHLMIVIVSIVSPFIVICAIVILIFWQQRNQKISNNIATADAITAINESLDSKPTLSMPSSDEDDNNNNTSGQSAPPSNPGMDDAAIDVIDSTSTLSIPLPAVLTRLSASRAVSSGSTASMTTASMSSHSTSSASSTPRSSPIERGRTSPSSPTTVTVSSPVPLSSPVV